MIFATVDEVRAFWSIHSHYDAACGEIDYFCGGIPMDGPREAERLQARKVAEWRIEQEARRAHV